MTNNKRGGFTQHRFSLKSGAGFTLIEMLVVVAIIGLLASVVVVGIGGAREKARDTKRIADLRSIQSYLEVNYSSPNGYPDIAVSGAYPASLPKDPSTAANYGYCRSTDKQSYILGTTLENAANRPSGGTATLPTGCTVTVPAVTCSAASTDKGYCITN